MSVTATNQVATNCELLCLKIAEEELFFPIILECNLAKKISHQHFKKNL